MIRKYQGFQNYNSINKIILNYDSFSSFLTLLLNYKAGSRFFNFFILIQAAGF